jgi:hypothetical protein
LWNCGITLWIWKGRCRGVPHPQLENILSKRKNKMYVAGESGSFWSEWNVGCGVAGLGSFGTSFTPTI